MRPSRNVTLRAYAPADLPAIAAIDRATTAHLAGIGFPSLADHMPDETSVAALVEGRAAWVAVEGDAVVGFAVASDVGPCLWLHELGVEPAHHGRGVGTMLLAAVVDHGRWAFQPALALDTFRTAPAQAFYAKRGFMPWPPGHVPGEIEELVRGERPPGFHPAARVVMVKRL